MAKKKKTTTSNLRTIACSHLTQLNDISNAGQPLCSCKKRGFVMAPFNLVCQVCVLYKENGAEMLHKDLYVADAAPSFVYDFDEIDSKIEIEDPVPMAAGNAEELDDFDDDEEIVVKPKKKGKKKKSKKVVEEDDDDDLEIEEITEEINDGIEGPIIGIETKEKEESLDYEDEAEEGLGKKHGLISSDDDDEEDEDDIEEFDDEDGGGDDSGDSGAGDDYDFQEEVIDKIKMTGEKEICPFCHKSKASVLRHLSKCARAPPEAIAGLKKYRTATKKKTTKKKTTKKKTTKKK